MKFEASPPWPPPLRGPWSRCASAPRSCAASRYPLALRRRSPELHLTQPLSAEIDHDRLQLGEPIHREASADAADPAHRAGPPAEGQVRLPVVRALVHVHPARPNGLGEPQPPPQVLGEDRREQPVRRAVDEGDCLVLAPDRRDRYYRPERLFAR